MSQATIDFIEHYGKKGMHWGVRNRRTPPRTSSDFKKTAPLRNRKTSELTNKQLQNVNARIKLEKTYRQSHPSKVAKGQKVVAEILGLAATAATIYGLQHNPAIKAMVKTGAKRAAEISAKFMKTPYEQLVLFK